MTNLLAQPLTLPCGATLPNRLSKAAMTEGLATAQGVPTPELERLYGIWSDGGAGMLLSGNIQIDRDHLERPGNVIVDSEPSPEMQAALASWAKAATRNGNHFWAQISHAGRQTQKIINKTPKAPSAVKLGLPGGQFGEPVALTAEEIAEIVRRFAVCAAAVKAAGFTGVQVHSAHGYLFSQFLSPRSNLRTDQYGGTLANRARALLDAVAAVRKAVGPDFPVSVKLNSADFQKGGFDFEDSLQVVQWLEQAGVDLIEISGGTYEQPKLLGLQGMEEEEKQEVAESTMVREAYFVDFALAMQKKVSIPLMVTGGFRQRLAMEQALESGSADVVGLGRPMCVMTDAPKQLMAGLDELPRFENELSLFPSWLEFLGKLKTLRAMAGFAVQYWFYGQIDAIGRTGQANPQLTVFKATQETMALQKKLTKR
ncbi:NADH:flavin oxidoreductase/NADH oxidase family protein [Porticoccaceae bacterium]|jgi:2,4-dienoyl-CoA reductase-like NADH-dependent reductase (Old Yellow Enzyme family)|nr:NADH:flavin oxidoreductase/NADH oxidase family protein [bacterium]MDA8734547.1 NADH:flavin oxidoreductase/NADH oxidase family protein [Porticoccaceae bacterium]MDA8902907.1 NADH:flavin oxidoreductase/NADH oxidase family protein [Porticoccaceae bacterium]MDA8919817.1 NADH:flavin oxidoreductase/NADH oxidase family protein [Porticoccaceae bacterium]MDB2554773.1 NADH:flavin oxidoreductase/NADH oxidase family protein [Porticoccaceae bacterium]